MRNSDKKNSPFKDSHDQQITENGHDEIVIWLYEKLKNNRKFRESLIPPTGDWEISDFHLEIESPLKARNGFLLGFIDLKMQITLRRSYTEKDYREWPDEIERMKREEFEYEDVCVFVEVKTSVNIGETLRQIRYYRQDGASGIWAVCAPHFKGFKILKEQNIKFIEYDPEGFL